MSAGSEVQKLRQLARLYGAQPTRRDLRGRLAPASPEGLVAILRALGAPIDGLGDVPSAWRERRQAEWRRPLAPVAVAWDGEPAGLELRLPLAQSAQSVACRLELEGGEKRDWTCDLARLRTLRTAEVEGVRYAAKRLSLPGKQPCGYHRLSVQLPDQTAEALVVSAPGRAYEPTEAQDARTWGVF